MRETKGGTRMFCPSCETLTACAAITYSEGSQLQRSDDAELWFFARLRECQACKFQFETVEIEREFFESFEWRLKMTEIDEELRFKEAHGANQTILNWNMDLQLKIEAIERQMKELRALHDKITSATDSTVFLKSPKV